MFRPVRTLILVLLTFFAGIMYERARQSDTCLDRGGAVSEGICIGVDE
ncbi:hypothetical protein [uncultured Roseobacter sp.]|nr:hypothetical protein [uncultured Roseobacter sp.]